nr:hypothetical protein [Mesorhizobium sp. LNHC220B00]
MTSQKRPQTGSGIVQNYFRNVVLPYDAEACLIWPYSRDKDGYARIGKQGKTVYVSRLVCEEEHGPPPSPKHQAAHGCGNGRGGCVTRGHLSWKEPVANNADKLSHGTYQQGVRGSRSKLTEENVRAIRSLKGHLSRRQIALQFGISKGNVGFIHSGRTWGSVV